MIGVNSLAIAACMTCVHFRGLSLGDYGWVCDAFPGPPIPFVIYSGQNDHTQPIEGDHGIMYEHDSTR